MATVESEAANGTLEAPDTGSSSTESPTQGVPLTVKIVQGRRFPPIGIFKRQGRFFVQITVDKNKKITATSARSNDPLWGEPLEGLSAQDFSSSLMVEVYAKRTIFKNMFIGGFEIPHVLSLPQSEEHLTRILRAFGRQRSTLGTASLELIITRPSTAPVGNSKELMSPVPAIADAPEGFEIIITRPSTAPVGNSEELTSPVPAIADAPERFESLDVSGMNDPRVVHETSPDPVNVPQTASSSVEDIEPGPGSVGPSTTSADNAPPGVPSEELRQAVDAMHVPRFLGGAGSFVDTAQTTFGSLALYSDTWEPLWRKVGLCVNLADGIAEIHPYARIAWSVLSYIPRTLLAQVERDKNVTDLLNIIDGAYDFVKQAMFLEGRKEALVIRQKTALAEIWKQTTDCAYFILDYVKDTDFWKRTFRNAVISEVDTRRQAYMNKLEELKKVFRDQAVVTTEITVFRVLDTVEGILNDLREHDIDSKLDNMYVGAGFLSTNTGCLSGTREAFLKNIEEWINDPDSQHRVCVIFGQAGTGKSSIAREVALRFEQLKRLGSSFCFNRDDQTSRRPQRLFSNIARDLAYFDPHFKQALHRTIREGTYRHYQEDISWQLDNLILQPMKELRVVGPLVLVIDALDESGDSEGSRGEMLKILAKEMAKLPTCFRILVTSRAEPDITQIFESSNSLRFLRMDDNELTANTPIDILAYIRSRRDESSPQLQAFLNEDRCRMLAEKSERLFQWASVACNYLTKSEGGLTTSDQFKNLVNTSTNDTPLDALYKLYQGVLQQRFKITNNVVEGRFKSVMGRVLAAFEPLSLSSLAELHPPNDDPEQYDGVLSVVGPLSSLLSGVNNPSTPIRPLHTSFRDFLVNKQHNPDFYINPHDYHSDLAFACLRTLNTYLKFNMCRLETSYAFNKDVPNLKQRVHTSIPPFMSYACRFWAQHLRLSRSDDAIYHHVRRLLVDKLLFWIEALSLLREVETAAPSLKCVVEWTKGHPAADDARTMATDAYRFVRLFGACITDSAPHVYVSALPFTPESSHVFRNYGRHFPRIPRVCTGRANTWPQMDMVLTGHDESVQSVSFSPDGRQIVSGCNDGTIRLWSTVTGEATGAPLEGHTHSVMSVAFSPDGKRIVSGSWDGTVRVWSTETGEAIGAPREGRIHGVTSVAFSPDGKHIVSGSRDKTIHVWSTETSEAIGAPLEGHIDRVTSVAFSPDGKHIVSGSDDNTIRLWSLETREAIRAPLEGHTRDVRSVAFTPDGRHIVSGSWDTTVRVWSAKTGEAIGAPLEGHTDGVESVAFSPDGKHIVSGSLDKTICLWSAETGEAIGVPLEGHTDMVTSVAFSPDDEHIASGSDDDTIHLWSAATGNAIGALNAGHAGHVTSIAFSPDGKHIVFGSKDKTIRLWSSETGEAISTPMKGHTHEVKSVAFSPDGRQIISVSWDSICVWSAETGEAIGAPLALKGHRARCVEPVAFSPDGKCIVFGYRDWAIRLWSSETGKAIGAPLEGHTDSVISVAFSLDGKHIASGSEDNTIRLWSARTGEAIGVLEGHTDPVMSVAFSPDGRHIVSGSHDKTIRLWSSETGEAIGAPRECYTNYVASVAFSPDGRCIVSGSGNGTIRVWSWKMGEAIGTPLELKGHREAVTSVAFSPDGRCIASGSEDSTIRLWSVHNKREGVSFSRNTSHALANPDILLGSTSSPSETDARDLLHMQEDSWLVGPESRLLLWVPTENRRQMHWVREDFVIGQHTTELDLSDFAHGPNWHECYVGEDRDVHGGSGEGNL